MPKHIFKDISIHFTDRGKGPAVVLIHGFLENLTMWKDIEKSIIQKHRVICVDLPGHGKSDCIGYVHTMDEMAEAIHSVLRSLRLRKYAIVGHSMGGYVALAYAEKHPDNLRDLVLYQSTAKADSNEKKRDRKRAATLIKKNPTSFIRKSIPLLFRPVNRKTFKKEIKELIDEAVKTSSQGLVAALEGMRIRPNRELLLKFPPYPVHIVAGDKDPRIPIQESIQLSKISEFVTLHVIKGIGHMSYIEAKEETIQVFKKILK
ncbi:MAG: alpha/beta hydrolase [Flavobacteriales bacterium]|nr:alpha/beta hydrolase [Flavobacteriales bacterium]